MTRKSVFNAEHSHNDDLTARLPFFMILYLVIIAAYAFILVNNESLREPARLIPFTVLLLMHSGLHLLCLRLPAGKRWVPFYIVVQGALVFAISWLTSSQWFIIGLSMTLVSEAGGLLWPDRRAVALVALFFFVLILLHVTMMWGFQAFVQSAVAVSGAFLLVLTYVLLFTRQTQAREQAQSLLRELEIAHRQLQAYADQVEELTITQERERMACELHDTLAQGVAGLILQLEAVDSHLENDNADRAQVVVQQAMQRARTTLDEARRAIRALRPSALEKGHLIDALRQEVDQLAVTADVHTTFEADVDLSDVSPQVAQNILRIVQECLSNIDRHAIASRVLVQLTENDNGELRVVVRDDGIGFDLTGALDQPDCFGLIGMQERATRLGGAVRVESVLDQGTKVTLKIGRE
ncbi:MAG: sensor histidine kinase [Chloroflexi bacterium]|nr:sensor histidine kinase [Chloroflexota bacterium]